MRKVNLHTHTTYCDGRSTPEELVLAAIDQGFDVLGFSGHSYTAFDESYCMNKAATARYQAEIRTLAQRFRDRLQILCGVEQDFFSDAPTACYDYVIGSVHAFYKPFADTQAAPASSVMPQATTARAKQATFADASAGTAEAANSSAAVGANAVPGSDNVNTDSGSGNLDADTCLDNGNEKPHLITDENGFYLYLDWDAQSIVTAADRYYGGDMLGIAEDYYATLSQVVARTGCQIIGHFDLLTKFNEQQPLFDTAAPRYVAAVDKALAALLKAGAIFEINTGAMAKGYRSAPYPSADILRKIAAAGGRIMINSDCHLAANLDYAFTEARALARACGFSSIVTVDARGRLIDEAL